MLSKSWSVQICADLGEPKGTAGKGYCGNIAMDLIVKDMSRNIDPATIEGIDDVLKILRVIIENSSEPLRSNWTHIVPRLRSSRERLAAAEVEIKKSRKNWMASKYLAKDKWLIGGALQGCCAKWNFSRWHQLPNDGFLLLEESKFGITPRCSINELRTILQEKMLCYDEAGEHFYSRVSDLSGDLDVAIEQCIDHIVKALFPHPSASLYASESDIREVSDGSTDENLVTPLSNWDGLLTAELLLRPSNDHKILDQIGRAHV